MHDLLTPSALAASIRNLSIADAGNRADANATLDDAGDDDDNHENDDDDADADGHTEEEGEEKEESEENRSSVADESDGNAGNDNGVEEEREQEEHIVTSVVNDQGDDSRTARGHHGNDDDDGDGIRIPEPIGNGPDGAHHGKDHETMLRRSLRCDQIAPHCLLVSLRMDGLGLTDSAIVAVAAELQSAVQHATVQACASQMESQRRCILIDVFINHNVFGCRGATAICGALATLGEHHGIAVRILQLFDNMIGDAGARAVADLIGRQCGWCAPQDRVREVHLSHNRITQDGAQAIFASAIPWYPAPIVRGHTGDVSTSALPPSLHQDRVPHAKSRQPKFTPKPDQQSPPQQHPRLQHPGGQRYQKQKRSLRPEQPHHSEHNAKPHMGKHAKSRQPAPMQAVQKHESERAQQQRPLWLRLEHNLIDMMIDSSLYCAASRRGTLHPVTRQRIMNDRCCGASRCIMQPPPPLHLLYIGVQRRTLSHVVRSVRVDRDAPNSVEPRAAGSSPSAVASPTATTAACDLLLILDTNVLVDMLTDSASALSFNTFSTLARETRLVCGASDAEEAGVRLLILDTVLHELDHLKRSLAATRPHGSPMSSSSAAAPQYQQRRRQLNGFFGEHGIGNAAAEIGYLVYVDRLEAEERVLHDNKAISYAPSAASADADGMIVDVAHVIYSDLYGVHGTAALRSVVLVTGDRHMQDRAYRRGVPCIDARALESALAHWLASSPGQTLSAAVMRRIIEPAMDHRAHGTAAEHRRPGPSRQSDAPSVSRTRHAAGKPPAAPPLTPPSRSVYDELAAAADVIRVLTAPREAPVDGAQSHQEAARLLERIDDMIGSRRQSMRRTSSATSAATFQAPANV